MNSIAEVPGAVNVTSSVVDSVINGVPEKKKKNPELSWFPIKSLNHTFYTPFVGKKVEYFTSDEGKTKPTPSTVAQELNKGMGYVHQSGVFSKSMNRGVVDAVRLPAGCYNLVVTQEGERLDPISIRTDDTLCEIERSIKKLDTIFSSFIAKEDVYRENNLIYKLGILAYGQPGNGKSSSIRKFLNQRLREVDGVAIFIEARMPSTAFLNVIKKSLKNRIKVFIFEEFIYILKSNYMDMMLSFLDGEYSLDKCVSIATTNYPDKIPTNMTNRPGRFDKSMLFGNPNAKERSMLIEHFLKRASTEDEVRETEGFSIAGVRECCIDVLVRDKTFPEAVKEAKERDKELSTFNSNNATVSKKKAGF